MGLICNRWLHPGILEVLCALHGHQYIFLMILLLLSAVCSCLYALMNHRAITKKPGWRIKRKLLPSSQGTVFQSAYAWNCRYLSPWGWFWITIFQDWVQRRWTYEGGLVMDMFRLPRWKQLLLRKTYICILSGVMLYFSVCQLHLRKLCVLFFSLVLVATCDVG